MKFKLKRYKNIEWGPRTTLRSVQDLRLGEGLEWRDEWEGTLAFNLSHRVMVIL